MAAGAVGTGDAMMTWPSDEEIAKLAEADASHEVVGEPLTASAERIGLTAKLRRARRIGYIRGALQMRDRLSSAPATLWPSEEEVYQACESRSIASRFVGYQVPAVAGFVDCWHWLRERIEAQRQPAPAVDFGKRAVEFEKWRATQKPEMFNDSRIWAAWCGCWELLQPVNAPWSLVEQLKYDAQEDAAADNATLPVVGEVPTREYEQER